jgi:hypothetical protein
VTRSGWIARAWADTGGGVRVACLVMWLLGVLTTAAGVLGDAQGWWTDRPFLTNLVSSLAGALFGIPIALIVIQRITALETYRRERQDVVRFARVTIDDLLDNLTGLSREPDLISGLVDRLRQLADELLPALPRRGYGTGLAEVLTEWREVLVLWPEVFVDQTQASRILRRADVHWRFFRNHVEPRLRRHQVTWVSTADADTVGRLLSATAVHYRDCGEQEEELADAAERALTSRSTAPLVRLYGDDEAMFAGIEEQVEELAASAGAVAGLLDAVTELAMQIRQEDLKTR